MWRNLGKIIELLSDNKIEKIRRHRFPARIPKRQYWGLLNVGVDGSQNIRVGHVDKDSTNIVPLDKPNSWFTVYTGSVELFITEDDYITKIAPLILSGQ